VIFGSKRRLKYFFCIEPQTCLLTWLNQHEIGSTVVVLQKKRVNESGVKKIGLWSGAKNTTTLIVGHLESLAEFVKATN